MRESKRPRVHPTRQEASENRTPSWTSGNSKFKPRTGATTTPCCRACFESPVAEPTGNELFDSGYARVRAYLDAIDDLDRFKSALAIDYCLAFLGYGVDPDKADEAGSNAAYPYESIYRTGSKSLGGDHCAEVSDAFRAYMFAPTRDRLIADDHIA